MSTVSHSLPTNNPFPAYSPTASPTFFSPYTNTPGPSPTPIPTLTAVPPLSLGTPFPTGGKDVINVLLLGRDLGMGTVSRTDAIIIASVRPGDRMVTMISIPRDLYVHLPGYGMERINAAYLRGEINGYPGGGFALLKDTILYNLGVEIDYTAMVDFSGFRQIVNTLGGIDLPLACPYTDWWQNDAGEWVKKTVGPGVVHMDGKLALWYARSRLASNDFDRNRRQQEVLRAIYTKGLHLDILPRLPDLFKEFQEIVITDVTLGDLLNFAPMAREVSIPRIRSYAISGKMVTSWITPAGGSVLLPNSERIQQMLSKALAPPDNEEVVHLRTVVEVWNWASTPGWDVLAAERLNYGGFQPVIIPSVIQNAQTTLFYDLTVTPPDDERDRALLDLLGLDASALRRDPQGGEVAYRLILGQDFEPCFYPSEIER